MQDSDDYFTDDFVLDETALAVLDEEEQKYTLSTQNTVPSHVPPHPKRLKTETGWRPGPNSRRADTMDDQDYLPEISVQGDGSYGLHARHAAAVSRPGDVGIRVGRPQQSISGSRYQQAQTTSSIGQQRRDPALNSRAPQKSHSTSSSSSSVPFGHSQSSHQAPSTKSTSRSDAGAQIDALHCQMEELRKENERIQSALQDAQNKRMAKEGEVSVLRKNIERTAQDHSAQVAKLRAAKEEADMKQAQIQKEVKEEMERLRTQYTFKQHELETSIRKPPWSTRSRKINTEAPSTPIEVPAQMSGWNSHYETRTAGPSNFLHETPQRPRFGTLTKESPKTIRNRKMLAHSPKKSAKLPGFYNSFAASTPVRANQHQNANVTNGEIWGGDWKGKGRASVSDRQSQFLNTGPPPPSPPSSPTRGRKVTDIEMPSDDVLAYGGDAVIAVTDIADMGSGDVEMMDDNADDMTSEELDEIVKPNWQEELHRMILTHTAPSCTTATFQVLMKAPLETAIPAPSVEVYSKACTQILEVLAATSFCIDWESALYTVAKSLTDMAYLLSVASLISPLTALLSLLTNLSYSLPSFSSFLLSPSEEDPDGRSPAKILVILCDVIRKHLIPTRATINSNEDDVVKDLATSTIALMESLCWNIPEDLEAQLAVIPRSPQVLSILLDSAQPPWLWSKSARLLVFISTRPNLFRSLLSYPDPETPAGEEAPKEFTKVPHIERLCSILIDSNLREPEAQSLKDSILIFFTMLSVAHNDALTILLESLTLIPSLVVYLTHLTTPFREDDVELMASPSTITSSVRAISRTVVLLNYLVFSAEPTSSLRQKLQHAPHRQFNGISYLFIVTFGTLSYADPPEWVTDKDKIELEQIREMARDLLDLVVEGPEGDSVYGAYQSDTDEGSVTDDEEMEARLLDANEL